MIATKQSRKAVVLEVGVLELMEELARNYVGNYMHFSWIQWKSLAERYR